MASVSARDIPEEQQMWIDLWNFRKKYYEPEEDEEYIKSLTDEAREIGEKYKTKICRDIVIAILNDANRRYKRKFNKE